MRKLTTEESEITERLIALEKANIFRITHINNMKWILANGLHCRSSATCDPHFVEIGKPDLIQNRAARLINIPPGGTLSDYIPFYFTPFSPMLLNIRTGHRGLQQRPMSEIVILVASLRNIARFGLNFVFSDRHAFLVTAQFYSNLSDLDRIRWDLLRARDFARDPEDPAKMEHYQAEALIFQTLPIQALTGIACYDKAAKERVDRLMNDLEISVRTEVKPEWYC